MKSIVIGISGRSGSGKSTISKEIIKRCKDVAVIQQDKFFKKKTPKKYHGFENWDCPESLKMDKLKQVILLLKKGKQAKVPEEGHTEKFCQTIIPGNIVIVEGFLLFYNKELAKLFDKRLYIDVSDENLLARRLNRPGNDMKFDKLGDNDDTKYIQSVVIPMSRKYEPNQKKLADIVINGNKSKRYVINRAIKYLKKEKIL